MANTLEIKNVHGTFTCPERVFALVSQDSKDKLIATLLRCVYDGTEYQGNRSHFARYSHRSLAIMVCDTCHGDD